MGARINYTGKIFRVPLGDSGDAIGLVGRQNKNLLLGYFFPSEVWDGFNLREISPADAIYAAIHGPMGFKENAWEILGDYPDFDPAQWPIPAFKNEDPLRKRWYRVDTEEDLETDSRTWISEEEAAQLWPSGVAGHVFLEKRLKRILEEAKISEMRQQSE